MTFIDLQDILLDDVTAKIAEFYPQYSPRDMEKNQRLARAILKLIERSTSESLK